MATKQSENNVRPPDDRIAFGPDDLEVMDIALDQIPELRICAAILKTARASKLKYPVKSKEALTGLLPQKAVAAEGHRITPDLIDRYLRNEYLPIKNERELVARCYLAFVACREDISWAARAPEHAPALLKEYQLLQRAKGGR